MGALTKDAILASKDFTLKEVEVPEWGGSIFIGTMTGKERDNLESAFVNAKDGDNSNLLNLRAKIVAITACDPEGVRLFTLDDIEALGGKSSLVLDRLFTIAQQVNGMSGKDVEGIVGNS